MASDLAKKLQLKAPARLCVLNAPSGFSRTLVLPAGVKTARAPARADAILFFATTRAELEGRFGHVHPALTDDTLFWVAYPKKSAGLETDIHRDAGWETLTAAGWRPVRLVALDDTWSAVRLRPFSKVKATSKNAPKAPAAKKGPRR